MAKVKISLIVLVALVAGFVVGQKVQAGSFEPGSYDDPLVSESYVTSQVDPKVKELQQKIVELEELSKNLTQKINTLEAQLANN